MLLTLFGGYQNLDNPKANISNILVPSDRMKLHEDPRKYYKKRPSGHDIGKGFAKDNGGAIPPTY